MLNTRGLYKINTFGCQMNVHESEKLAGILQKLGFSETDDDKKADIIVFNTCCIRETAETRAMGRIDVTKGLKKRKKDLIVAVVGCMTQQDGKAEFIKEKKPFVDIVLGTSNLGELGPAIEKIIADKKRTVSIDRTEKPEITENQPLYRTSGDNAWVNIMYGCDNFCTYCIVPYVRGRERSRKMQAIIEDVRKLAGEGYKKITLLGQNVNSYGKDIGTDFTALLKELSKIDGDFVIKFMTSHPKDFNDEVIDIIAESDNIEKSIHLPVQSGSNDVLSAMNRNYTRERYLDIIKKIREKMPDAQITTDFMVGFPGETDKDFEDTLDLVRQVGFSNAFTFIYSPRKGTEAAEMENQISMQVKKQRITALIKAVNESQQRK